MKIRVFSDLHLEMDCLEFSYKFIGEDVLVLAGDIYTKNRHSKFLDEIPSHVKIIMVPGNHEAYMKNFEDTIRGLRHLEYEYPNFKLLHNEELIINGVHFFGGMMCTDFSLYRNQPLAEITAERGINDFHMISKTDPGIVGIFRKWSVEDHKAQYKTFVKNLKDWLKRTEGQKRVVISHFAPIEKAIAPQYKNSLLNPYFVVDNTHLMGWEGYWFFGHVHSCYEGSVGDTKLICNPKGYGDYENLSFNENLVIEI